MKQSDGLNPFSNLRDKLRGMTPREIAAESLLRGRRRLMRAARRLLDHPNRTRVGDEELIRALDGKRLADVAASFRRADHVQLTAGLDDLTETAEAIKQLHPESIERTTREAGDILAHRIPVFDDDYELGPLIDWHADPATGVRWPVTHFSRVHFVRAEDSDVRRVWELNRLHHLTTLGRAYVLTGDEQYARELIAQFTSWCAANPPRYGVNWSVAMEAGIRAVNLVAAFQMCRASRLMTDEVVALVLKCLLAHGRFISENIEYSHRATSNHYLSDLIGLLAIGATAPEFNESRKWMSYAARALIEEMHKQVLADGVDYEGTTNYHRLVLEIFTLHFTLGDRMGLEFPPSYRERLKAMFDFVLHYLKPDGTAPAIGDSDDGTLWKFTRQKAADHSHLLSLGAAIFDDPSFKRTYVDEEAVWWFGAREAPASSSLGKAPTGSKAFSVSQVFIQREGPLYAIIDCGDHGARGRGSHAHSDALSIEVFAYDRTFLRDPGTYLYTGNERLRNLFRSTESHNTVRVDGRDISLISRGSLFSLGPNVTPKVNSWESTPERDVLDAEHDGYANLAEPVIHRRIVTFEKREGYWVIEDIFTGSGSHQFEFFFNFDAGLEVTIEEGRRVLARGEQSALAIVPMRDDLEATIVERWVSPSFGKRVRSSGIIYRVRKSVPFRLTVLLVPCRAGEEARIERTVALAATRSAV